MLFLLRQTLFIFDANYNSLNNSKIAIIGGGISGLAASCFLAKDGYDVTVYEKNETTGGRARVFSEKGFVFDMGPSWYWMPDVYEDFFKQFGKTTGDYYNTVKLDPGFQVIFANDDVMEIPADTQELKKIFEAREPGSAARLEKFLREAAFKYNLAMKDLVRTPALSWSEFVRPGVIKALLRSNIFSSVRSYVRKHFKDPGIISLLEFPVLFLGAMPDNIPALYTLMNHAALTQGTFYPQGGMHKIMEGISSLASSLGVKIQTQADVSAIHTFGGEVKGVHVNGRHADATAVISSADYHHTEQALLQQHERNYNAAYWERKTMAPSCIIFYLGIDKKLPRLRHHNLFFDTDFEQHSRDIYESPKWPADPLFYVCCPSKTDDSVAPAGSENLFVLIPVAPGLKEEPNTRQQYFDKIIGKLESFCGTTFRGNIVVNKSYGIPDFIKDYHSFKGNAYGLANTLRQTAVLKPKMKNKKIKNLYYTGQLTVPGPGLPPALISGEIAAKELIRQLKKDR